jgi:hypothetical protein
MNNYILPILSLILALSACAGPQRSRESVTNVKEIADVSRLVGESEDRLGGSRNPVLLARMPARHDEQSRIELWTFESDGNEVVYRVVFHASKTSSTDITVSYFGQRFVCGGGTASCFEIVEEVCGNKDVQWGNPFGGYIPIPATMRDEKGRVMMIVRCDSDSPKK